MDVVDTVAAKRFILVDDQGTTRAELAAEPNGLVGLNIWSKGGESVPITLHVSDRNGTPSLMVYRPAAEGSGEGMVMLSVTEAGKGAIWLQDADGTTRHISTRR
jgi:hypothetical protein